MWYSHQVQVGGCNHLQSACISAGVRSSCNVVCCQTFSHAIVLTVVATAPGAHVAIPCASSRLPALCHSRILQGVGLCDFACSAAKACRCSCRISESCLVCVPLSVCVSAFSEEALYQALSSSGQSIVDMRVIKDKFTGAPRSALLLCGPSPHCTGLIQ